MFRGTVATLGGPVGEVAEEERKKDAKWREGQERNYWWVGSRLGSHVNRGKGGNIARDLLFGDERESESNRLKKQKRKEKRALINSLSV